MMAAFTFYTHPQSRGRTVRWACEELVEATGIAYDTEIVEYAAMKAPEYLAVNPMGKVPAIVHGPAVVTEVAACLAYLGDAFPDARLAPPPGSPLRAPYYRWMFFLAGPFEQATTFDAFGVKIPPERERSVGFGTLGHVQDALEQAVSNDGWIAGDHFTMADLHVAATLGWATAFDMVEKRPAYMAFLERCATRPAAIRAGEIDNALIGTA